MPETEVIIFVEESGECPFLDWLDQMPSKAQVKCIVRIERLEEMGHELRRPEADYLRDNIYELRATLNRIHYRVLYFFFEKKAIISHGLTKEGVVPPSEIEIAQERKIRFNKNPLAHTYKEGAKNHGQ